MFRLTRRHGSAGGMGGGEASIRPGLRAKADSRASQSSPATSKLPSPSPAPAWMAWHRRRRLGSRRAVVAALPAAGPLGAVTEGATRTGMRRTEVAPWHATLSRPRCTGTCQGSRADGCSGFSCSGVGLGGGDGTAFSQSRRCRCGGPGPKPVSRLLDCGWIRPAEQSTHSAWEGQVARRRPRHLFVCARACECACACV